MEFIQGLQQDLQKQGYNMVIEEEVLDISSSSIVNLNNEIGMRVDDDRIMLETSPGKAARYACSK